MSDIWSQAQGERHVGNISGTLLRMVESQEQIATLQLVDALDKQAVLEDLLEGTKPHLRAGSTSLHYLLATPFRYPPLRHGSRYGTRHEPSLFYGALSLPVLLAESAYYRLVFWDGMTVAPPRRLSTQHAIFEVAYATDRGLRLQQSPFDAWQATLVDPADYRLTQALGSAMRGAGVMAFEYPSARDPAHHPNVGLFAPQALAWNRPGHTENWLAETTAEQVRFHSHGAAQSPVFSRHMFEVDGRLPHPAA